MAWRFGAPRSQQDDRRLPWPAEVFVSNLGLAVALGLTLATVGIFIVWHDLDLDVAALFYTGQNRFVAQGPWGDMLRRALYDAPFGLLAMMALLYGARRAGLVRIWAPSGRGLLFLLLSLALGPGLLVNTILKDHAHRPRPYQVTDFGGTLPFRPLGRFDGGCSRNCSFVSGEGSTGFWTLAPALLAPSPALPVAIAAALAFGTAASLLRMAFGGHFLSDTILAALFTWLVIIGCWRMVFGRPPAGLSPSQGSAS